MEQNTRIATLDREMNGAADRVAPLIEQNLDQANRLMAARVGEIARASQANARLSLFVLVCATVLGIFFAVAITARIVRPVRQMAGVLDDLAYETPSERIATVAGGRDEINAMAQSLNTLADHRARFLAWWKASVQEASALRDLHAAPDDAARAAATAELRAATLAQAQQLNAIRGRLLESIARILDAAKRLRAAPNRTLVQEAETLERTAHGMTTLLELADENRVLQHNRTGFMAQTDG